MLDQELESLSKFGMLIDNQAKEQEKKIQVKHLKEFQKEEKKKKLWE